MMIDPRPSRYINKLQNHFNNRVSFDPKTGKMDKEQAVTRPGCWLLQAALMSVFSCRSVVKPPPRAPFRPRRFGQGAPTAGRGTFCTVDGRRNHCTIYNDHTGQVWVRGTFVLEGRQDGVPAADLRYTAFDGRAVHLQDGRALVLLDR